MMADIHPESRVEAPEAESPKPVIRESAAVKPHEAKWHQRLAAALIFMLGRTLAATVRFRMEDHSGYFSDVPQEKLIFAIWHNRLSLALILYRIYVARRDRNRQLVALVSASRDGGMMARVLELFDVHPVRGSSSRRGAQAMLEMVSWAERGHDLAITPDGPRGPRYVVQEGVISTARLTGLPIVPVSYRLSWKIQLKSWDRFQIPLPFTRCDVVAARAIRVPREATDEEREILRQKLETELRAVTRD
jgi:lysophospholipid acyltransferase (LPLAT)-like uncharacterized protein